MGRMTMIIDIMGIIAIGFVAFYLGNFLIVGIVSTFFSTGEGLSTVARAVPFIVLWSAIVIIGSLMYIGTLF